MGEVSKAEADAGARLAALERNDSTQDRQISELFERVNTLERQTSAQAATLQAMQADLKDTKTAAQAANDKLDGFKMWMLGITASSAVTLLLLLVQIALKNL